MAYTTGDILRVVLTWRNSTTTNVFKNVLNFRLLSGGIPSESSALIIHEIADTWLTRVYDQHMLTTHLSHIKIWNQSKPLEPADEALFLPEAYVGGLLADVNNVSQASACIVRHAYLRGRKGIGRYFHGPLNSRFVVNGVLLPDPALFGDLQDVMDALGDPLEVLGVVFRPIVCGSKDTTANSPNDIRRHEFSPLVTFMRSRRVGIGE